jgi:mono/diheme cytochrome c family protein
MMSFPSPSPSPRNSSVPAEVHEEDAPEAAGRSLATAIILWLFRLLGAGLLVYLSYFFTMTFSNRQAATPLPSEEQQSLARKAEELRAKEKTLLGSYGWINPAVKSVRIPIDRAMELIAAEAAQPSTTPGATSPIVAAPAVPAAAGTTMPAGPPRPSASAPAAAPSVAAASGPSVPAAPTGMAPEQIYRMVCMACHDTDGKGKIVRLAMPTIPDLTDPKWQASRTDAELTHSILEGKDSVINGVKLPIMLPMKDKLALAHTDVKDMVAFMRKFKDGKQVVSATGSATPEQVALFPVPAPVPAVPAIPAASPPSSAPSAPSPPATTPVASATITPAPTATPPASSPDLPRGTPPVSGPTTNLASSRPTVAAAPAALPPAIPEAPAVAAARAEQLRTAGTIYNTLCIPCHGQDGRGTLIRPAMPAIPDFTSHDWHTTRSNSQLSTSILEGKGTLMPPWNTKVTADQARSLAMYVRSIGAPELLAAETASRPTPSTAEFEKHMLSLKQRFDDLERQLQALSTAQPARP